jgi:hypothetical protein
LRSIVFANVDGLFAFNCSAEDAKYLVPELGGALDEQDLVELGEHQCYARWSANGSRRPTFSVSLDPPLVSDPELRAQLAATSAERYGRPAPPATALPLAPAELPPEPAAEPEPPAPTPSRRNQHRPRKHKHLKVVEAPHA